MSLANQRVLVMGLGRFGGGVGVTRWLVGQGAHVTLTDTASPSELADSLAKLADLPSDRLTLKLGGHDLADFTACDLLVTNPAVDKAQSPFVQAARKAGIPLTTEMNLFLERNPARTVGITGSVGKSTTTMLTFLALSAALGSTIPPASPPVPPPLPPSIPPGPRVFLGGNIGKSLLAELATIRHGDVVVLELSSFMLEDTPAIRWSPNIALVTNLFPNHLDRHGDLESYGAAKQNILAFQKAGDTAILNADHTEVAKWKALAKGKVEFFSVRGLPALEMLMPGEHNQSNGRAALAVVEALAGVYAVDRGAALKAMAEFAGLAHRLELVHVSGRGELNGAIRWYNDSKATTPEASMTALEAFDPERGGGAICIVGGYDKHSDMGAFAKLLAGRAVGVVGIGQTGRGIVGLVRAEGPRAGARVEYVETLERAVGQAWAWARESGGPKPAVLLSPGCASWGQFQNYERRGEIFAELARAYP